MSIEWARPPGPHLAQALTRALCINHTLSEYFVFVQYIIYKTLLQHIVQSNALKFTFFS